MRGFRGCEWGATFVLETDLNAIPTPETSSDFMGVAKYQEVYIALHSTNVRPPNSSVPSKWNFGFAMPALGRVRQIHESQLITNPSATHQFIPLDLWHFIRLFPPPDEKKLHKNLLTHILVIRNPKHPWFFHIYFHVTKCFSLITLCTVFHLEISTSSPL